MFQKGANCSPSAESARSELLLIPTTSVTFPASFTVFHVDREPIGRHNDGKHYSVKHYQPRRLSGWSLWPRFGAFPPSTLAPTLLAPKKWRVIQTILLDSYWGIFSGFLAFSLNLSAFLFRSTDDWRHSYQNTRQELSSCYHHRHRPLSLVSFRQPVSVDSHCTAEFISLQIQNPPSVLRVWAVSSTTTLLKNFSRTLSN